MATLSGQPAENGALARRAAGFMDVLKCKLAEDESHPDRDGKGCLLFACAGLEEVYNFILFVPDGDEDFPFVVQDALWEEKGDRLFPSASFKELLQEVRRLAAAEGVTLGLQCDSYSIHTRRCGEDPAVEIGWETDVSFSCEASSTEVLVPRPRIGVTYQKNV